MKHAMAIFIGAAVLAAVLTQPTVGFAQSSDKWVVNKEWAQLPPGMTWDASTSWITPDGKGNVVVLVRKAPFFRVFTREGKFVKAWGDDPALFKDAHSVMFDKEGNIWATDAQGHVVYKFTPDGKLLMTLGKMGQAGDDTSTELFNRPNHVAIAPNGDIYVSDGYVNARVVHFTKEGKFVKIIGGKKGAGPGEMQLPHGVVVDSKGRIIVSDSDNKRISVFDKDGKFVEHWAFTSRGGSIITADDTYYVSDVNDGTVNIIKDGKLVDSVKGLGRPHGVGLDNDGAIYVSDSANRMVIKVTPKK
jgi:sugar lactone lactonase YvrE